MTTKTVLFPESLCYQVALLATGSARRHMYVNVCVRAYTICKCTHRTEIEAQTNANYVDVDVLPILQTAKGPKSFSSPKSVHVWFHNTCNTTVHV